MCLTEHCGRGLVSALFELLSTIFRSDFNCLRFLVNATATSTLVALSSVAYCSLLQLGPDFASCFNFGRTLLHMHADDRSTVRESRDDEQVFCGEA